ncbi:hypothetical protein [Saccharopolyspora antimicrobica]|uniref:hypothetical protein n=1 Tax=Saccharopolyspora antimicrobica TaxID=455193 RepID=UPI001BAACB95|nr:hypothetical protein [Saccharopolyspora antimicrobica]
MLLFEEPTNNLGPDDRHGCLLVVSHDERFPGESRVDRWLRLESGWLVGTAAPAATC